MHDIARGIRDSMKTEWFDRFVEAVEADPRSLAEISRQAGLGQNYVQQLIKNRKDPGVAKLIAVLDVLGSASILYVVAGIRMSSDDEAFLQAALSLEDPIKEQARAFFETLKASGRTQALPHGVPEASSSTDQTT